jgi:hypothetical protein
MTSEMTSSALAEVTRAVRQKRRETREREFMVGRAVLITNGGSEGTNPQDSRY